MNRLHLICIFSRQIEHIFQSTILSDNSLLSLLYFRVEYAKSILEEYIKPITIVLSIDVYTNRVALVSF